MDSAETQQLIGEVRQQLFGHILPFWSGPALDKEQGGWLAWMSNDLRVDRAQPKGLIGKVPITAPALVLRRCIGCPIYPPTETIYNYESIQPAIETFTAGP